MHNYLGRLVVQKETLTSVKYTPIISFDSPKPQNLKGPNSVQSTEPCINVTYQQNKNKS